MLHRDTIFVGGAWLAPAGPGSTDVVDPATGVPVASVPRCSGADVDRAVASAVHAFGHWSQTLPSERAALLAGIRDVLEQRASDMADVITTEMGAPRRFAEQVHVGLPLQVLSSYVELLAWYSFEHRVGHSLVVREPAGVVGALTSWDYPLHQVVAKVAPALAAGCTVVLKPSEGAPLSAYFFTEILQEAGVPSGVVNLVPGTGAEAGEALAGHPDVDVVSFTGRSETGRRVAELAAGAVTRTTLELGGTSANVVLPDADLAAAVRVGLARAWVNAGQAAHAWSRFLVHRSMADEAVRLLADAAGAYAVGPPRDERTRVGPVASAAQRDRVLALIRAGLEDGARLVCGGLEPPEGLDQGFYVRPTILADVPPGHRLAQEEIFGPVLVVIPYADADEALAIANGTPYGLAGGVWSADAQRAMAFARRMRCGQVDINGARFNPRAPFGGYKHSGIGRELGSEGLEGCTEVKSLQL